MKPLAIVIPWFGKELTGGAEQQAFQIATRLAGRGVQVEVLTTCNISFSSDWSINHYQPGAYLEDGLCIRRFSVDQRNTEVFDRVNRKLLDLDATRLLPGVSPVDECDERVFIDENIKSQALLDYLKKEANSYSAVLFLPYMFQSTMVGALTVGNALVQPCLHDEPQAYFSQTAEVFRKARWLLFNSEGEYHLALRLYGPGIIDRSEIVGEGIELPDKSNDVRLLPEFLKDTRFVLYLGRRDKTKNVNQLVEAFTAYKAGNTNSKLLLALAGPGDESFNSSAGVHDLGLVSGETRVALLRNATVVVQPSRNESFSRVMMEAWSLGRPVAVNRVCEATAVAVNTSGGGWTAGSENEWVKLFRMFETMSDAELDHIGEKGREYARDNADWNKVIPRYEALLEKEFDEQPTVVESTSRSQPVIHQLLPDVLFGDAISNQARAIRLLLRKAGYRSDIFAKRVDQSMRDVAVLFDESRPEPLDSLIYHHSIGSEVTSFAEAHPGRKCLIYHNITPAEYFAPFRPGFAWLLEVGRARLGQLARSFRVSVGDSAFNASELASCGFHEPGVLPIIVEPSKWNIAPDQSIMNRLQDGLTNIIFVGRLAPNKKQDRLVEAFHHYLQLDPNARLILAGEARDSDPYVDFVKDTISRFELTKYVELTEFISESALLAYYRTAHLYWSFSEHEGFGAPLAEAMWFDVPVLALSAGAVAETIGSRDGLFEINDGLAGVARRAHELVSNSETCNQVIEQQRERRADFESAAVWPALAEIVEQLIGESKYRLAG